jgi:hypothetical protein
MIADNTFAGVFFALLIWVPIVFFWVAVLVHLLKRSDLSGAAMAIWLVVIVVFPIVGSLVYFALQPRVSSAPADPLMHPPSQLPPH